MAQIEGDAAYIPAAEFKPKIECCLSLLNNKAGQFSTWFKSYNLKIRAAAKSGANFKDNAIDIGRTTFDASETCIHESIHFWQYRAGHYQAGNVAEVEANRYQLRVLTLIGAPASEIAHMQSQTGNHADLNGDGVYDEKDYEKRNY